MALTVYNIKKWYLMLTGKSVLHVNQSLGRHFKKGSIKGYYNDMREKVLFAPEFVESDDMPFLNTEKGDIFYFPVGIFQYAFGLLDLYFETHEVRYINKFQKCAEWALEHQFENGGWDNFSYYYPNNPYGAMAQGEGVSLLIRAYAILKDEKYFSAAKKAIDFMLLDCKQGGCTSYIDDMVILLEYPHRKAVMNGWIFAWWGLYDYVLVTRDETYRKLLDASCKSLIKMLPDFKNWYWSIYDLEGRIASPFYHNLHVAQMQAMYQLTGENLFNEYANRWLAQQKNPVYKGLAFMKKALQKIVER